MSEVGLPSAFVDALTALAGWLEAEQVPHDVIVIRHGAAGSAELLSR